MLRTDHKALTYLCESKNPISRLLRWFIRLQGYKFRVEYIKGEDNASDGFSRICRIQKENNKHPLSTNGRHRILEEYHLKLGHESAIKAQYKWDGMFKDIDLFYNNV